MSDAEFAAGGIVVVAFITVIGNIIVARISLGTRRHGESIAQAAAEDIKQVASESTDRIMEQMDVGNAHTSGQSLARLEDQVTDIVLRIDRMEVNQVEAKQHLAEMGATVGETAMLLSAHINEVQPLADWTKQQMEGEAL